MKKITVVSTLALVLAASGLAAEFKGMVRDQKCAGMSAMKGMPDMKEDATCAKKCIQEGSPAVLVTEKGKVYKIANQDKIVAHAGEKVTITGTAKGSTITVESVQ